MIYVYAIADAPEDLSGLTGVENEPLEIVAASQVCVIVGELPARPGIDADALRRQDTLVRALHARTAALLPMRFGTTSADRGALIRTFEARPELPARLAAVRGCEQMVIRVFGSTPSERTSDDTASGTAYLHARARRLQPAPALARIADALRPLVRDTRIEAGAQPGLLGSVYHLIARGSDGAYRDAVERLARDTAGVRVIVSGPSPVYAFA